MRKAVLALLCFTPFAVCSASLNICVSVVVSIISEYTSSSVTYLATLMLLLLVVVATLAAAGVAGRPSEDTIRYQIQEELPAGTRVGNVVSDAGLRRRFPTNVVSLLEYRFLSEPAIPLVIGLSDGVIRTSGAIDRDSMPRCRQRDDCDVLLDVTVQPVAYFLIIKISIEVSYAIFQQQLFTAAVYE